MIKEKTPTELALLTWYAADDPRHKELIHPAIALAGECGELLDLLKKEMFKPDVSWSDCKICKHPADIHYGNKCDSPTLKIGGKLIATCDCPNYESVLKDELGDLWYYIRILAYILDHKLEIPQANKKKQKVAITLTLLNQLAATMAYNIIFDNHLNINGEYISQLNHICHEFCIFLAALKISLDELTELNYQKLNSESTNHGWNGA